jgi:hypothetical protein
VAQLAQEEGAARAALEALKLGASLTQAREVGERVLRQAQELPGKCQAGEIDTTGGVTPSPACVLLHESAAAAAAAQISSSACQDAQQPNSNIQRDQAMDGSSGSGRPMMRTQVVAAELLPRPAAAQHLLHQHTAAPARHRISRAEPATWAGTTMAPQTLPAGMEQLQAQMTAVQEMLSAVLRADGVHAPAQALAAPLPLHLPKVPSRQNLQHALLGPAPAALGEQQQTATCLSLPRSAAAWAGGLTGDAAARLGPGLTGDAAARLGPGLTGDAAARLGPGLTGDAAARLGPGLLLANDPELAATAAAHARHMALLHMQLESARGTAELQQLQAQLAVQAADVAHEPHRQRAAECTQPLASGSRQPTMQPISGLQGVMSARPQELWGQQQRVAAQNTTSLEEQQPITAASMVSMSHLDAASGAPGDAADDVGEGGLPASVSHSISAAAHVDEALLPETNSALLTAHGSTADTDVLQVQVSCAGPFSRRGSYRVSVMLYSGQQPLQSAPSQVMAATTSARAVEPQGSVLSDAALGTTAAAAARSSSMEPQACSAADKVHAAAQLPGHARWSECLALHGVRVSGGAALSLVFLLHLTKPGLAGLPPHEALVAWASAQLAPDGVVPPGVQSVPLYRLPLVLVGVRRYSYEHALLDFSVSLRRGAPGDLELRDIDVSKYSAGAGGRHSSADAAGQASAAHEDVPGIPAAAWVRVTRGVPPADPYSPGDGFVLLIDGARFLPDSTTISRVTGVVMSRGNKLLAGPFQGTCAPDGDALCPRYTITALLGSSSNGTQLEDPTATLQLQARDRRAAPCRMPHSR